MSSRTVSRWLPVVVWAACISLFSTEWFTGERTEHVVLPILAVLFPWASPSDLQTVHAGLRKAAHFLEYLLLSILLYRALRTRPGWDPHAAWLSVVFAGLHAIGDEVHQAFVPGRTAAARDCFIDVSGATAGQGLVAAWHARRTSR